MAYVKSTAAGAGCLRQTSEWRPKTRIFMGTRIALHIRALCRYTVATAFPHHCGKGFSALRKRLSGNAKHTVRTHEKHRPERRKRLSGRFSTGGRDCGWHETHTQDTKSRLMKTAIKNMRHNMSVRINLINQKPTAPYGMTPSGASDRDKP